MIGYDLADTIDARVGTTVLVTSPQGELTPLGLIPKFQRFRVAGIFHSGFYQYDSMMAFTSLADAQRLFGEPDVVSVISFKVDDLYRADQIGRSIEQAAGPGFLTTNWMEQNRPLFRALRLEQIVTFIVIGLIVCVAALNILTALTMMVMEKTRDIAVMMSFGVQPRQVRMIFLLQGLLIGFTGTLLGLIAGYGLSWLGGHYRFPSLCRGLFDRLSPFRRALDRRADCGRRLARRVAAGHSLSLRFCCQDPACRGSPLRMRSAGIEADLFRIKRAKGVIPAAKFPILR